MTSPPGAPTPTPAPAPTPKRAAWFHCFAGIAGDMALGSLLDAGADLQEVLSLLERLPVPGWKLEAAPTMRSGIGATAVTVLSEESPIIRTAAHIVGLIEEARLPQRVRDRALAVFAALADAEGRIHRRPPASVHFHEVGGVDAIVDVVGTCAALEVLEVDDVYASAVATGTGMVRSAHGVLPNPGPAVLELLRGAPIYGRDVAVELTTPTGAALLAGLVSGWGPMPPLTIEGTGYGAGTRELDDLPNLTQVVLGTMAADGPARSAGQPVVLLETNLDDATGETVAHAISELLAAGAHDAWVTPVLMKKGRPGYTVSALSDPALASQVAGTLASETGSLGVRGATFERWPAPRSTDEVAVAGHRVRVKVSPGRVKVEQADAARVARLTGLPLREVSFRAEETWRQRARPGTAPDGDEPA
ncbi:MAG: nickel pincer cofactor biosynthesis protein LarC [Actinobacteria bacterium]|nr:nickel pincer cofactor biosynthesis protein LarC [Actinomycetota bacterium]